ncbi:Arylsulfatase A [Mariniphaga anaerophila]|uniref:Arylsulfatase A n=1 Tax=Mariniphaga anaerophila TaxID=1484053 RepID=A0A1M4WMX2_9BACT|nr:sulfatase [Mariniphaga anaerophila]SHE82403.1 Arylsulfatase A [Mariniphaga anaerophila]
MKQAKGFLIPILLLVLSMGIQAQKPNVLFIISDDLNTRIGPYMDIEKHTPNLDRLAEEGVKFSRTYCQYPLCGPSRTSLMSGLYPESNGVLANSYVYGNYRAMNSNLKEHPSMTGFLREQGYFTARVSKIYHMGVPGGIERGEAGPDDPDSWDYAYNVMGPEKNSPGNMELLSPKNPHYGSNFARMIIPNNLDYTQTDYLAANQAIAILEGRAGKLISDAQDKHRLKENAPFFLAVGLVRPHVPLIAPQRCFEHYPTENMELPEVVIGENVPEDALQRRNNERWGMSELQQKKAIGAYMASVRFMDEQVGRLLDALDRMDLRKNTIVVFVSDHGYNLGEHDCWSKVSLWEGSVRTPMIISHPGFPEKHGTTCSSITELIDLYPTFAEFCGFSEEQPEILQGTSLAPFLEGTGEVTEKECAYTVSYGGKAATIRTNKWRYTRWGEKAGGTNEELYNHENDPEELTNLVGNTASRKTLNEMRQMFDNKRNSIQRY